MLQLGDLRRSWNRSIGEGGGYRRKITATPAIAGGQVFTMDSDGAVSAFDVASGNRHWNTDTQPKKDRSTNVGGGLAAVGGTVYATTGRAEALALDARTGKIIWRSALETPARSAPTVVDNRLFVTTLDDRMLAFSTSDGKRLWSFQATAPATSVLGAPAPAYADGLVVGGFGSGDLVTLRADTGTLAWSDSLAAVQRAQQPGRPVRHPRLAGGLRQRGLRDRRRRLAAGARPALRPAAVGARDAAASRRPGLPATGCSC